MRGGGGGHVGSVRGRGIEKCRFFPPPYSELHHPEGGGGPAGGAEKRAPRNDEIPSRGNGRNEKGMMKGHSHCPPPPHTFPGTTSSQTNNYFSRIFPSRRFMPSPVTAGQSATSELDESDSQESSAIMESMESPLW